VRRLVAILLVALPLAACDGKDRATGKPTVCGWKAPELMRRTTPECRQWN